MIRQPTLSESYEIAGWMDQSMRGVDSAYDQLASNPSRRWLSRHLALPVYFHWLNEGWLLEDEGTIVGWLYLLHHTRSTHINDIGVRDDFRRQGYGRRLMAWAEERAYEKGKEVLTLAVTTSNDPAVSLYEMSGFRALHHTLWQGDRTMLPRRTTAVRPRELDRPQRAAPFRELWARALEADGHPDGPLLADQISYWYSERGQAWELWQASQRVGYADWIAPTLRLFMQEPTKLTTLQASWSALSPSLPRGRLLLDLGSDRADAVAAPLLEAGGWTTRKRERMLMVRQVGSGS